MNKSLDYFNGNELPASVWTSKYALRRNGKLLEDTPDQMHLRLAKEFARIEDKYKSSKQLSEDNILTRFKAFSQIIPQGSVMAILGNPYQIGSLSNCVVLPKIYDSYGGIMYADQQLAQLMKRRCGVGLDDSTLRPDSTPVSNAAQSSTGATSFMSRFSNTTREVAQDGRRGALMISRHINHPEAAQFATIKQDLTKVTGANISLKLTNEFMNSVETDTDFFHRFPITFNNLEYMDGLTRKNGVGFNDEEYPPEYDKLVWTDNEYDGKLEVAFKRVRAKELWNTIIKCAHNTAEPGLIFWDRQHIYSPSSIYPEFENISTNPCSEIAMGNDSCRLMAANMFSCVINPFTKDAYFDEQLWYQICYDQMRLMDDLVDLELEAIERIFDKINRDPEPDYIKQVEIDTWKTLYEAGKRGRRTGAGFTALGDTLAGLGLGYSSDEGIAMVEKIARIKFKAELDCTIDMAVERGPFEAYDAKLEAEWAENPDSFFYMIKQEFPYEWERMQLFGRRNISWSTTAPTGSLSLLASLTNHRGDLYFGTTSGIEPMFNIEPNTCWHIRKKKINANEQGVRVDSVDDLGDRWQHFRVFHSGFLMWVNANHPQIDLQSLSIEELKALVAESPYGGSGSSEIDWRKRLDIQAVVQKYTTHSISSTINLPKDVDVETVSNIYFEAWRKGLKGITIYRDGSRSGVLVDDKPKVDSFEYRDAPKRPKDLVCEIHHTTAKGKRWTVIIGLFDEKPFEVFAIPFEEGLEKYHQAILRKKSKGNYVVVIDDEISFENITEEMTDEEEALTRMISTALRHGSSIDFIVEQLNKSHGTVVSFNKAISRVLSKYAKRLADRKYTCLSCVSENVRFEEGCYKCVDCGSSKCG
jgi:ribonucleoside-diphosphate reductase alpha chain